MKQITTSLNQQMTEFHMPSEIVEKYLVDLLISQKGEIIFW
jgi:hypothetical protein